MTQRTLNTTALAIPPAPPEQLQMAAEKSLQQLVALGGINGLLPANKVREISEYPA